MMAPRSLVLAVFLGALIAAPLARAQQPSSEPILRVETGMHTAPITQAAADAAGQILATASQDKTLRLWSLTTGQLIRIIRPPIGDHNIGKLSAVAVSPDGKTVAVGGVTGFEPEKSQPIFLFETANGGLVRRIPLPLAAKRLAWSRDGRFIAAAVDYGMSVVRAADGKEVQHDEFIGDSYGIAFDHSGRLATVSDDGIVRLYDSEFRRIALAETAGGKSPYSVAFSPDGTKLVIGYLDATAVDVLSTESLKRLFQADTNTITNGDLNIAAWSSDGALLAGGSFNNGRGNPILRWPQGGKGATEVLAAGDNRVTSLIPLADGGFAYSTGDPAFGRYDARQQRVFERSADTPDYRWQSDKLRLSADAVSIGFGLASGERRPMHFSVAERQLTAGEPAGDFTAADTKSLPLTDWLSNEAPKLTGKPLKLNLFEHSRCVAVAANRKSLLLGAEWHLYRFDSDGSEVWSQLAPATTWAVNVSRDGRLAVAAFGDGTIRWYRYSDGQELLALFIHKDGKRWVLWTPQGYFDAAPGAEDLIGWHVNRGLDHEADFFPASRFRDRFYKPEVVSAVLKTLDIEKAVAEAKARPAPPLAATALPPLIKILSPQEGAAVAESPVPIRYAARSPSGEPITAIDVKVDGRPVPELRGLKRTDDPPAAPQEEQEGTVAVLIDKDATITLIAHAGERSSEGADLRLVWRPPAPPAAAASRAAPAPAPTATVPKPKLYVLAVGVSRYKDPHLQLRYAAKDAADVVAAWTAQQGGLYSEVVTRLLRDEEATRDAVLEGFDWIERETTSRDVALVLLAGHGDNDGTGAYYFLPHDADLERLRRSAVPDVEIRRSLSQVAGKALFFFDTCHSGAVMSGRRAAPVDVNGFVSDLASAENGLVVFAASTGREFAQEREDWGHGAFSKALLEGLSGKADLSRQGVVTVVALEYWLSERVKELTRGQQHPTTAKPSSIRDFPIAVARAP